MFSLSMALDASHAMQVLGDIAGPLLENQMPFLLGLHFRHGVEEKTPAGIDSERPNGAKMMRESWTAVQSSPGFATFENTAKWAPIVEFGMYPLHWKGVRTVICNGKRYSGFAPGGVLTPMIENSDAWQLKARSILDDIISQIASMPG